MLRLVLQSQKTISAHYHNDIIEHPNRHFSNLSHLETTIVTSFPSKNLNYTAVNLFLQKFSTLTITIFSISTTTDITLQTSMKHLREIMMWSAFTTHFGYDKSTIILIDDDCCPNTKCSGKNCLHKKTFQTLGRSDYQCRQRVSARCSIFFLKIKQILFS